MGDLNIGRLCWELLFQLVWLWVPFILVGFAMILWKIAQSILVQNLLPTYTIKKNHFAKNDNI